MVFKPVVVGFPPVSLLSSSSSLQTGCGPAAKSGLMVGNKCEDGGFMVVCVCVCEE